MRFWDLVYHCANCVYGFKTLLWNNIKVNQEQIMNVSYSLRLPFLPVSPKGCFQLLLALLIELCIRTRAGIGGFRVGGHGRTGRTWAFGIKLVLGVSENLRYRGHVIYF